MLSAYSFKTAPVRLELGVVKAKPTFVGSSLWFGSPNQHVVAGGSACTVLLANGQPYEAKFIASDANYDLAVLKIDGENLPTAEFLDSDTLQVGNAVYAIGTPLDLEMSGTFTNGIVSSMNREMQLEGQSSIR